jgi:PAS domain S-box-containing protein
LIESPEVAALLDRWARTTSFLPASVRFRVGSDIVDTHCDGALVRGRGVDATAVVLDRCRPKNQAISAFLTLNRRVADLTAEIGRRQRAEGELQRQREWFHVTLSSIGDGVIATDAEGRIMFLNGAAEHYTGWSTDEALGLPLTDVFVIVNESTRKVVEAPVDRVIREGVVVGLANHTVLLQKGGGELAISDSAAPIRSSDGKILGVVLVFQDETVRRFNDTTRRHLLERERDAKERAESASRLKDEFFANLSHELRTPLNAIQGWAEVLSDPERGAAELRKGIEVIDRNVRTQVALVDQLLDVARIVSGRLEVDVGELDLARVVAESCESLAHAARAKAVSVHVSGTDGRALMVGDELRLRQAIWNLLSNAIKFTPAGRSVYVELRRHASPLELEVRDEGMGIPQQVVGRLFEPFWQADSNRAGAERGLGLGLSIVLRVVEAHGGTVVVSSPGEGQGASFCLRLPVRAVSESAAPFTNVATPRPGQARTVQRIDGLRVLVVEDEADSREIVEVILSSRGAEVKVARAAAEALALLDRWIPDVLLSDISMPGMDGYALVEAVRSRPLDRGSAVPAAALTAFASDGDRRRALEAGFDLHLPKPMRTDDLVAAVANLAEVRSSGGRASGHR